MLDMRVKLCCQFVVLESSRKHPSGLGVFREILTKEIRSILDVGNSVHSMAEVPD